MNPRTNDPQDVLEASALVRRFASRIAAKAAGAPILDAGCGGGRNAFLLASLGCKVVCVDKDITSLESRLESTVKTTSASLTLRRLDLLKDQWPFPPCMFGGIINVHFLRFELFEFFQGSLRPEGYLLVESEPGCGGNYLQLPKAGEVQTALANAFEIEHYKERQVGPKNCDAVTVKLLARRLEVGAFGLP